MLDLNMNKERQIAELAAKKAGEYAMKYFEKLDKNQISEKQDFDFVTNIDKACEHFIREEIAKAFPKDNILGEEQGGNMDKGTRCWIIDPLDGTLNYIHGFPLFAVSIGLVSEQGELLAGAIYLPVQNEMYSAVKWQGATLNGRKIHVSKNKAPKDRLLATGFPFKDEPNLIKATQMLRSVLKEVSGVRMPGAAAVHLAFVACGRLDGFWEHNINAWDMAAGAIIVKEAGGSVYDYAGGSDFLRKRQIVATNASIDSWILAKVRQYLL